MNDGRTGLEIAVIGLAGRFPGAQTIDEFWHHLKQGDELISPFVEPGGDRSSAMNVGGVLRDIEQFDAAFFGFNPREAETMDPQHRLLLECAWEALEDAGYHAETEARAIGVFAGIGISTYLLYNLSPQRELMESLGFLHTLISADKDYGPTRVSYKLNLRGPSLSVQTACSSSLVAVHVACQNLLSGECDMALAAGVSVKVPQNATTLSPAGIIAADGHCKAFAADASGTLGGNGLGVAVLKRLEDAIADRDHIYAVIKGSAMNNDGAAKVGYTAPSQAGQTQAIRAAHLMAEVDPETIDYMETHGTGTPLGDPIEVAAMTQAFRMGTDKTGYCAIGSVKTNIGHLDAAAGIAGFIKTVLALHHGYLPPSLNFASPNPHIDFERSPFYVNTQLKEWRSGDRARRAGVSSFGFGGTNCHVVLEEAPAVAVSLPSRPCQLLLLSAKTSSALDAATANLASHLQQHPDAALADVAYTLQAGRKPFNYRRLIVAGDRSEAIQLLTAPQQAPAQVETTRPVAFMFPGQGSQSVNMALEVYRHEPGFREQVDRCCARLQPLLGLDLRSILYPDHLEAAQARLEQTALAQPALFVIEYALAQLWRSWGVQPVALIGHSIGEYVAACLAGVFSLEDALDLVVVRSRLMQQQPVGAMLAVSLAAAAIEPFLGDRLALAADNAPNLCVLSGPTEEIIALEQQLRANAVDCRRLHTSHAFHSAMMDGILTPFNQSLRRMALQPPQIPFISNLTGTWITPAEATDPDYWTQHLRQSVRFNQGLACLVQTHQPILLEVGPGRSLSTLAQQQGDRLNPQTIIPSLPHARDRQSSEASLLTAVGRLWLAGVAIDWAGFYQHEQRDRVSLPTYPFERQCYWIDPPSTQSTSSSISSDHSSLVNAVQIQADQLAAVFEDPIYLAKQHSLEQLCIAHLNQTLRSLGAFQQPSDRYTLKTLLEQLWLSSRHQGLLSRWLHILVDNQQLEQQEEAFTHLAPIPADAFKTLVEAAKEQFADTPQWLNLIQTCGESLALALFDEKRQLDILFPRGTLERLNCFFRDAPLFTDYSAILQSALHQISRSLHPDTRLNILEIGAGTGVTAAEVLPILPADRTIYTFTDPSASALEQAQQQFSDYAFVEYRSLDIEADLEQQGFVSQSFDVIVAHNVLHTTKNLKTALDHCRSLLAPGGLLLLWEVTAARSLVFELVFSPLHQRFADQDPRSDYPFLSQAQWQQQLQQHGFTEIASFPEHPAAQQHIFLATAAQDPAVHQSDLARQQSSISSGKKTDIAEWFYAPVWKQSRLLHSTAAFNSIWLVFMDECGLGELLVQQLEQQQQTVVQIRPGETFAQVSEEIYTLNPRSQQDYDRLITELISDDRSPQTIAHLWSVTKDSTTATIEQLEISQTQGFYSLLYLTQAIVNHLPTATIQLGLVSNHLHEIIGTETVAPEKATMLGAIRRISLEYPQLHCRSIDIAISTHDIYLAQRTAQHLIAELTVAAADIVVAYRGKHRWVQTAEPIKLAPEAKSRLRHNGVYLITGGLGGIGFVIAEHLARTVQAKLILIGRSPFPDRQQWPQWLATHDDTISSKIRQIQELEALGAEVLVARADVAYLDQMQAVVQQATQKFGQIHGVIHAAGTAIPGSISAKTDEAIDTVLSPKVKGTLVLGQLFAKQPLDYFMLFSSISALSGGFAIDYAAANAFLDAYAHWYTTAYDTATISVGWDNWQQVGMALQFAVPDALKSLYDENQRHSITPDEGIQVFEQLLRDPLPHVLVCGRDLQTVVRQHQSAARLESDPGTPSPDRALCTARSNRPHLNTPYIAPRSNLEAVLTTIWQNLLGIEAIGVHDDFFALGGHSLLATRLLSQVNKTFGVDLPLRQLFESPTVEALAQAVIAHETQAGQTEKIAQVIRHLKGSSGEPKSFSKLS